MTRLREENEALRQKIEELSVETILLEPSSQIKSLNQSELARRLGVSPATVRRHKSQNSFPQWSQERDPQKIAWKYRRGKFYPMGQGELSLGSA